MSKSASNNRTVNFMVCDLCGEELHPLDAHMGRMEGELITAHIECWNAKMKETAHREQDKL